MPHEVKIRWVGVDVQANVVRFMCSIGHHGERPFAVPIDDVGRPWCPDGTWTIRVSGYLDHGPLEPYRYVPGPHAPAPVGEQTTRPVMSAGALDLMKWLAEKYVQAGFPGHKVWTFTPTEGDVRAAELRALGLLYFGGPHGGPWNLTEKGVAWIMANR